MLKSSRQQRVIVPLTPDEVNRRRAKLQEDKEVLESIVTGKTIGNGYIAMQARGLDVGQMERRIKREEAALECLSPRAAIGRARNKVKREFEESREYIRKHGLTKRESGMFPSSETSQQTEFNRIVRKSYALEQDPEYRKHCERLKIMASRLEPENPDLRNIENHRI